MTHLCRGSETVCLQEDYEAHHKRRLELRENRTLAVALTVFSQSNNNHLYAWQTPS